MSAPGTWIAIAVAGGLGACARLAVDHLLRGRHLARLPLAVTLVNSSGALLAGGVAAALTVGAWSETMGTVVAGGFLGAYTTFSTTMLDTARLLDEEGAVRAAANALLPLLVSVAAAAAGFALVARMVGSP